MARRSSPDPGASVADPGRNPPPYLHDAAASGTCCLVATHNEEIVAFAHRVLHIRDGVVAAA